MSELETETAAAEAFTLRARSMESRSMEAPTAELVLPGPGGDLDGRDPGGFADEDGEGAELEVRGSDADLLAIPPRMDDLGSALAARPPRLKLPKVTTALVAAALLCGGFLGGVLLEKHEVGSSSARGAGFTFAGGGTGTGTGAGAGGTGRTGRGGFGGLGGAAGTGGTGAGGNAVTGTVTVVSGNTLYITAADGSVYTVTTTGSTTVSIAQAGSVSQLKPGEKVVVSGSGDSNGNVTATSITAGSSGTGATPSSSTPSTGGQ